MVVVLTHRAREGCCEYVVDLAKELLSQDKTIVYAVDRCPPYPELRSLVSETGTRNPEPYNIDPHPNTLNLRLTALRRSFSLRTRPLCMLSTGVSPEPHASCTLSTGVFPVPRASGFVFLYPHIGFRSFI